MSDIERFYAAIRRLERGVGGRRLMSECTGRQLWPVRGVYFFFEPGELTTHTKEPRIVRVGTHAVARTSKTTLWQRLRAHRGTCNYRGNHRGSIFRLHVGAAIAAREPSVAVASWGVGQTADASMRQAEEELERLVSTHMGAMSLLWLAVQDQPGPSSDRAYLERNLIGMLAGRDRPASPPSQGWLGHFSPDKRIRLSGLWNLDFVDYTYSSDCLDVLEEYVLITTGGLPQPPGSM